MSKLPYMKFYVNDYLVDTFDLTPEQHGTYLVLLMLAWRQPTGDLPDDDKFLAKWLKVHGSTWKRLKRDVLERFFERVEVDGNPFWRNNRLHQEHVEANNFSDQQSVKAIKKSQMERKRSANEAQTLRKPTSVSNKNNDLASANHSHSHSHIGEVSKERETEAEQIISHFQATVEDAFDDRQRMSWHFGAEAYTIAGRWVTEGVPKHIWRQVITGNCRSMAARGKTPPRSLRYFDNAIREAIAAEAEPFEIPINLKRTDHDEGPKPNGKRPSKTTEKYIGMATGFADALDRGRTASDGGSLDDAKGVDATGVPAIGGPRGR